MRKLLPSIRGEYAVLLLWEELKGFYATDSSMFLVTVSWQSQDSPLPQNSRMPTASSPAPDNDPTAICELLLCNKEIPPPRHRLHHNSERPNLKCSMTSAVREERHQLSFRRYQRGSTAPTKPNWAHPYTTSKLLTLASSGVMR